MNKYISHLFCTNNAHVDNIVHRWTPNKHQSLSWSTHSQTGSGTSDLRSHNLTKERPLTLTSPPHIATYKSPM